MVFEEKQYEELNNIFEKNLEELADLLKEVHDKIISGEINSKEELITVYEKKINEMASRFPDINHERVKSYFDRYDLILTKFEEYKEKRGNI
ncbi:hypothetical protein KKG58_00285 [Patescibacteria group bacterium]|nr:hypothetical protein [Patescibacteria group bacterium]